jgi:hypothetical protein
MTDTLPPTATARYETAATAPAWVSACAERCPECCGLPDVAPSLWAVCGDVLLCAYRCPTCGHGWAARWAVSALDGAA